MGRVKKDALLLVIDNGSSADSLFRVGRGKSVLPDACVSAMNMVCSHGHQVWLNASLGGSDIDSSQPSCPQSSVMIIK